MAVQRCAKNLLLGNEVKHSQQQGMFKWHFKDVPKLVARK